MGKKGKSLRSAEKAKQRRAAKMQRTLLYESQSAMGKSKARQGAVKTGLRVRDVKCKNIGDLRSNPEQIWGILAMGRHYSGRYKRLASHLQKVRLSSITKRMPLDETTAVQITKEYFNAQ